MSLDRIDKSAFRPGQYVGYSNGVWTISRSASGWTAVKREGGQSLSGVTLSEINNKLAAFEKRNKAQNPKKKLKRKGYRKHLRAAAKGSLTLGKTIGLAAAAVLGSRLGGMAFNPKRRMKNPPISQDQLYALIAAGGVLKEKAQSQLPRRLDLWRSYNEDARLVNDVIKTHRRAHAINPRRKSSNPEIMSVLAGVAAANPGGRITMKARKHKSRKGRRSPPRILYRGKRLFFIQLMRSVGKAKARAIWHKNYKCKSGVKRLTGGGHKSMGPSYLMLVKRHGVKTAARMWRSRPRHRSKR